MKLRRRTERTLRSRRAASGDGAPHRARARRLGNERGHLMAGLLAFITIMLIFSAITFQAWEDLLHREREAEMMFRAQEIVRAIARYRLANNGQAPTRMEQLLEPGPRGEYFMRRDYPDPLVKDGKWGILYLGPNGQILDPSTAQAQQAGLGLGAGQPPPPGSEVLLDANQQAQQIVDQGPGLPIAGVKSLCTEKAFRVYNGFNDYSQWLFSVLDLQTGLAQPGQTTQGAGKPNTGLGGVGNTPSKPRP